MRVSDELMVSSDFNPDGSTNYIVTVSFGDDIAMTLRADAMVRYCATVIRAGVIALHDAAVVQQLVRKLALSEEYACIAVTTMREDREPLCDPATAPLRFEPIIARSTHQPSVHVWAGAERIAQWTPFDCFLHAADVFQRSAGVDLDSEYYRYLRDTVGAAPHLARIAVYDLNSYIPLGD